MGTEGPMGRASPETLEHRQPEEPWNLSVVVIRYSKESGLWHIANLQGLLHSLLLSSSSNRSRCLHSWTWLVDKNTSANHVMLTSQVFEVFSRV